MPLTQTTLRLCLLLSTVSLFAGTPTFGQSQFPDAVIYLLPIVARNADVPGAYGSLWRTETWVRNDANEPIRLSPCPTIAPLPDDCPRFYQPGSTQLAIDIDPATFAHASILYAPRVDAPHVTLSHRLLEVTRNAQPNGVAIPVVSEDEFLNRPSLLIAIPSDPAARVALRVFNPRGVPDAAARIEFLGPSGDSLAETVIPFALDGEWPVSLGFAFIGDIVGTFPQLAQVTRFDIRVSIVPDNLEYWAMATVTDRDTQHVLVITPH